MEPVAFVLNADYPQRTTFLQFPGKTACFSGHREDALPLGETVVGYAATDLLKTLLAGCIEQAVQDGYRYFLDGLAEGVDLWAADDLIYRKQHGTEVLHLIAVEPCLHYLKYRRSGREAMLHYVEHCEAVVTMPYQGKFSFLRRNDYMLEHSWRLICVIHKTSGGTAYTLKRASEKKLPAFRWKIGTCCFSSPCTFSKQGRTCRRRQRNGLPIITGIRSGCIGVSPS